MDMEQLKLILDAAQAAGTGATKIVVIWFAYKFTGLFLQWGFWGGFIYGIYRFVTNLVEKEYK